MLIFDEISSFYRWFMEKMSENKDNQTDKIIEKDKAKDNENKKKRKKVETKQWVECEKNHYFQEVIATTFDI